MPGPFRNSKPKDEHTHPSPTLKDFGLGGCETCGQVFYRHKLFPVLEVVVVYDHSVIFRDRGTDYFCEAHKKPYDIHRYWPEDRYGGRVYSEARHEYLKTQPSTREVTVNGEDVV